MKLKTKQCEECKNAPVYAKGEKLCNECWYSANFEYEV